MWPPIRMIPKVGPSVGLGHTVRCLALASKLRTGKARDIRFLLSRRVPERRIIQRERFHVGQLEPRSTLDNQAIYVVDLDAPPSAWPFGFKTQPIALAAIDDRGLIRQGVDFVVNQNVNANRNQYGPGVRTLIGPRYALLRREFEVARLRSPKIRDIGRRVIVSLGGSDPAGGTGRVLEALARGKLDIVAVVGPAFNHQVRLPIRPTARVRVVRNPRRLASLFQWSDVAISAGGSTVYELAACGTPAITVSENKAQESHGKCLQEFGVVEHVGPAERVGEDLLQITQDLLRDRPWRTKMSRNGRKLVDGLGTERVMRMLYRVTTSWREQQEIGPQCAGVGGAAAAGRNEALPGFVVPCRG